MPHTGKPSGACSNCKQRHIKCDETRPACVRCTRSGRGMYPGAGLSTDTMFSILQIQCIRMLSDISSLLVKPWLIAQPLSECPGYSEGLDLVLRNQNNVAKANVGRRQKRKSRAQSPEIVLFQPNSPLKSMIEHESAHSLCFFISTWVDYCPDPQSERGFVELIPLLYPKASVGSPLSLCISAISAVMFNKWQHKMKQPETLSVKNMYGKALAATSAALRDPLVSLSDETLLAVCLLGWYEACLEAIEAKISSPRHFEGAAALINSRQGQLMTDLARRMLVGVRSNLVSRAIQTSSPIDTTTEVWQESENAIHTPASLLDLLVVDVANLLAVTHRDPTEVPRIGVEDQTDIHDSSLLQRAKDVDAKLAVWPSVTPPDWMPTPVSKEHVHDSIVKAGFYSQICHVYKDVIICSTWNDWRTARLKVLALIARSTVGAERATALDTIQELADGICTSMPFCLGDRTTPAPMHSITIMYPTLPGRETPQLHYRTAAAYGGWYLFAPMKQVMAVESYLREGQPMWMRGQLQRLADVYDIIPAA